MVIEMGSVDSPLFIEGWVSHGSICTAWLGNAAQSSDFPGPSLGSYKGNGSVVKRFAALAERGPSFSSQHSQDSVPSSGLCESYI